MKIIVRCHQCGPNEEAALLEIGNDNLHQVTCDTGHKSSLVVTQQKHEILFEVATHAIVDGYYREAISSFSASLERYYEFFIKVISVELSSETFKKAWSQIASQSERQLGAYIMTYANIYGLPPDILPPPLTKLRNDVIHKGHIPSRLEAIIFGNAVAKIVNDGCNLLHQTKEAHLQEIIRKAMCPDDSSEHPTLVLHTYLNCLIASELRPFEEYLKHVQTHNKPRF